MFWTAFVWGLGVSFGASIGALCYVAAYWTLQWAAGKSRDRREFIAQNEKVLSALVVRNELTQEQVEQLNRIADSLVRTEANSHG